MRLRAGMFGACLAAVSLLGTACGAGGGQASGDVYVSHLHAEAVAKGYDGQAALLADGHVSYSELREADREFVECGAAQGVALKALSFTGMGGPQEGVEPVKTSGAIDAKFVNRVVEECQRTKQELVARAYAHSLPDLSEAAYALWARCAVKAGYKGKLPDSYRAIREKLDPTMYSSCDQSVTLELMNTPG